MRGKIEIRQRSEVRQRQGRGQPGGDKAEVVGMRKGDIGRDQGEVSKPASRAADVDLSLQPGSRFGFVIAALRWHLAPSARSQPLPVAAALSLRSQGGHCTVGSRPVCASE